MIPWRCVLACAAISVALWPRPLAAQDEVHHIRVSGLSGELFGSFAGAWEDVPNSLRRTNLWEQSLLIRADGSVVHPAVAAFSIEVRPVISRMDRSLMEADRLHFDQDVNRLMGAVKVDLFRESVLGGSVFARRDQTRTRPEYGGDERGTFTEWGATLADRNPLLPGEFSYQSRREARTVAAFGVVPRAAVDDHTGHLRYQASNSKTYFLLERIDVRRSWWIGNEVDRREFDLTQHQGTFRHRLLWGNGSVLASQARYLQRAGTGVFKTLSWDENASLRQSRTVGSALGGTLSRSWFPSGDGRSAGGYYRLSYQPVRALTLAARTDGRASTFGDARTSTYQVGPVARFALSLPLRMRLSTTFSSTYRWNRRVSSSSQFAEVIHEPHRPGIGGVFTLARPFVDPTSVTVFSAAGDRLYQEGADYRLVPNGSSTEVHVLPGSRIEDGEELMVDYLYELKDGGNEELGLFYDATLTVGPLTFSAMRQRDENMGLPDELPPGATQLEDRAEWGASLAQGLGSWQASASVSAGKHQRDDLILRTKTGSASLSTHFGRGFSLTTTASYRKSEGSALSYESRRATQSLRWYPHPAISVTGSAAWWDWRQHGMLEKFLDAGGALELGRRSRKVQLRYNFTKWTDGGLRTNQRLFVGVSQAFGGN